MAKVHKITERTHDADRRTDKDALDVYRLLRAVPTGDLARRFRTLRANPISAAVTGKIEQVRPMVDSTNRAFDAVVDVKNPGGWKPGLRWVHSFADVSGQLLLGLEGPIAPYLRLAVAFPFRYGDSPGNYSRYLVSQLPGVEYLERIEDGRIPGDPAAAVLVMLTLSIDF